MAETGFNPESTLLEVYRFSSYGASNKYDEKENLFINTTIVVQAFSAEAFQTKRGKKLNNSFSFQTN